ncbi:hypothetical protein [Streptomyces sp. NPDC127033]|uniref:hypothetical protein n=1 Tax=Streptomyces sp. NPDC127033 TaxID=3347110 RepID=UPI003651412F
MLEVIVGGAVGVLGIVVAAWATLRSSRTAERSALVTAHIAAEPREAEVEIVDASFVTSEEVDVQELRALAEREGQDHYGSWVMLDIKVRNRGGQTAYITNVVFTMSSILNGFRPVFPKPILGIAELQADEHHRPRIDPVAIDLSPSRNYQTFLDDEGPTSVPVSQVMKPGEADRFLVSIDTPRSFFRARVQVEYNAGRIVEAPKELAFLLTHPAWFNANTMLQKLAAVMEQPGTHALWRGRSMTRRAAGRLCMDEYEQSLRSLIEMYTEAGRGRDAVCASVRESLGRVPEMREALGLNSPVSD